MRTIPGRDRLATLLVVSAVVMYLVWQATRPEWLSAGGVAVLVLALGFLASASAVVPGFALLIHGSKPYLAVASLAGLAALGAGVLALIDSDEAALSVLVIVTLGLWAAATTRHIRRVSPRRGTFADAR